MRTAHSGEFSTAGLSTSAISPKSVAGTSLREGRRLGRGGSPGPARDVRLRSARLYCSPAKTSSSNSSQQNTPIATFRPRSPGTENSATNASWRWGQPGPSNRTRYGADSRAPRETPLRPTIAKMRGKFPEGAGATPDHRQSACRSSDPTTRPPSLTGPPNSERC